MLKNGIASSAIVIAGGLFASGALANTGGEMHKGQKSQDVSFQKLDQNGDGYISQNEFKDSKAQQQVQHDTLDTDNDGRINRTEFAAFEQMSQDQSSEQHSRTDPSYRTDETFESTDPTRDPGTSDRDY